MPFNILILPLCGGYYILANSYFFKYNYQRLESQRLLFCSIIAGIWLLLATFSLRIVIECYLSEVYNYIILLINQIPFKILRINYFWTSISSFLLAYFFTNLTNLYLFYSKEYMKLAFKAIEKYGNRIEILFRESVINMSLMQITLKNDKVYIGFSSVLPVPKHQEPVYLSIMPVLSGYRSSETKKLILTTNYFEIIEEALKDIDKNVYKFDFGVLIKHEEILSASKFDLEVFELFQKKNKVENKK